MAPVRYHDGRFPPERLDWPRLIPLIGPASAAVARYEGLLHGVPDPDVLLSPLTVQEAVLSSRIEGTQATLAEVLEFEAGGGVSSGSASGAAEIREVLNYRAALREATRLSRDLPVSGRLLRRLHEVLLRGVRGRARAPGRYRRIPVWIGPDGAGIERARFVPIGADGIADAMAAWERYVHGDGPDVLVQLAVAHAEFEAIHPFVDGNGRVGRLFVPLYLHVRGLLSRPNFYLSEYLEEHRSEYYDRLLAVSRDDDWTGWVEFFLRGVMTQADRNQRRAHEILRLYEHRKEWVVGRTRSRYAVRALDWIFARPIFRTSDFLATAGIPRATGNRILRALRDGGLLIDLHPARGRRAAVLAFPELVNIAEGREVL